MSYKSLEHATDAIFEVNAANLEEAFVVAAKSVIETIIDTKTVDEKEEKTLTVSGIDLRYLLYNWLEEIIILDRKSTRLNSSHPSRSRMPSSA